MLLKIFMKLKKIFSYVLINPECDKFWLYHYKKSGKTRLGHCYWRYFKNYIDYMICWNDKKNNNFFQKQLVCFKIFVFLVDFEYNNNAIRN